MHASHLTLFQLCGYIWTSKWDDCIFFLRIEHKTLDTLIASEQKAQSKTFNAKQSSV